MIICRWFLFRWRFELLQQLKMETVNSCTVPSTEGFSTETELYWFQHRWFYLYGKRKHCETAHLSVRSPSRTVCREQLKSFLGWLCSPNTSGAELMELWRLLTVLTGRPHSSPPPTHSLPEAFPGISFRTKNCLNYFNNFTCLATFFGRFNFFKVQNDDN